MFTIDFTSRVPIYEQICNNIIKLASAGVFILRGSQGYRRRKVCLLPVGSYNADYLPDNDGHLLAYPQTVGEEA